MNLVSNIPSLEHILAIAERVSNKYPSPKGKCAVMAKDLAKTLKSAGFNPRHVVGNFTIDEPAAHEYVSPLDKDAEDEYTVAHDWIEIEGKILDISAKQFSKYVHENIPEIAFLGLADPLANRYQTIKYV